MSEVRADSAGLETTDDSTHQGIADSIDESIKDLPVQGLGRLFLFLLPLLLVLPFDPVWPDFERARRALFLVLTGLYLLVSFRGPQRGPSLLFAPLLALPVLSLLSGIWAWDFLACFEAGSYYLALALVPLLAPQGRAALRPLGQGICLALVVTSVYGIAQHFGLDFPAGYTSPQEPVSTLGNRNVAAEWTTMAAPLAFFGGIIPGALTLLLAEIYLWFNGGRAALLGFHLCLIFLIWKPWAAGLQKQARPLLAALLVISLLLGAWTQRHRFLPASETTSAAPAAEGAVPQTPTEATALSGPFVRAGDTLAVRLLIYRRSLDMGMQALPLGVGAGNFRVRFPRYRAPEEIQISSLDGQLVTRVTTAHNDLLQIFTELGIPGLFCLLLFFYLLAKELKTSGIGALSIASLLAFVPLILTRAPMGNAPAALCFLLAVQLSLRPEAAHPWCRIPKAVLPLLGLLLLYPGLVALLGEWRAAQFIRAQNIARQTSVQDPAFESRLLDTIAAIDAAVRVDPLEPDWRLIRAQLIHRNGEHLRSDPTEDRSGPEMSRQRRWNRYALQDLFLVLERRRYEYKALAELGWIGLLDYHWVGTPDWNEIRAQGKQAVDNLLQIYPGHPAGMLIKQRYQMLDDALAGLAKKPGTAEFIKGHAACLAILERDPMNYTALILAINFALKTGQIPVVLEKLEKLGSKDVLLKVLRRVETQASTASGPSILRLLKIKEQLMKLGRKLFPDAKEFRQD